MRPGATAGTWSSCSIDRHEPAAASVAERVLVAERRFSNGHHRGGKQIAIREPRGFGEAAHLVIRRAAADNCTSMISIATILLTITSVGVSLLLAQAALVGVLRLARFDAQRRR
jgi:hypothetical protein